MSWHAQIIYWGYDEDREVICHGHVTPAVYAEAVRREFGFLQEEPVDHLWGRWVPSSGQFCKILNICDGPGRGAFPFTIRSAA